jgi:peptidoglycan/LPS O-acetylase OafA/YrhL
VYVGKISYGIYIWHMLSLGFAAQLGLGRAPTAVIALAATFVISPLSYQLYESRFLAFKRRFAT